MRVLTFIAMSFDIKKYYGYSYTSKFENIKKWSAATIKATILIGMCSTGAIIANSFRVGILSMAIGGYGGSIMGNLINKAIVKLKIL